jgi:hypothetical protein
MNTHFKNGLQCINLSTLILVLSACGDATPVNPVTDNQNTAIESTTDSSIPVTSPAESTNLVSNNFTFPEVSEINGDVQITIPSGPAPEFSARSLLKSGQGNLIGFSDPVVLKYKMYNWSSGELVENSDNLEDPVTVRAGLIGVVPQFLSKSLLGRRIGDQLQVVFASSMEDLPEYLDKDDAYVLVVDLL